jgi:hypothetical protein
MYPLSGYLYITPRPSEYTRPSPKMGSSTLMDDENTAGNLKRTTNK